MRSGTGYPAGGTQVLNPTIAHNLIENNSSYGLNLLTATGYGTTRNDSVIQDNVIQSNGTGIYLYAGSWWLGHVENNPVIRNNTVTSHTSYGIYMEAQGSSDNSGSDTKVLATVENNLLVDNNTTIHLYLYPRGSDGLQRLSPVIRYNSILNGSDGIVVDDAQSYDTLNPTISHNHFYGHSGYAVENQTGRTITANNNYWGSDAAAWDAGPQSGDTSGNVTTSSYLTSSHPPVLSRLSPGQAEVEEDVTLYGVNFGDMLQTTVIQYQYDPLYRLTGAVYTGAITATYAYVYDAAGNMTAYTETVGMTTTAVGRTFNAANQLVTSTDTELGTTSFYYDANGNLVEILPPGVVGQRPGAIRYTFNQRNLLTAQENYVDGPGWTLQAEFVYDGDSNRLQQIDHTGSQPLTTTYTNDIVGLSQVLVSNDGATATHNLFGLDLISQDDGGQTRILLADGLGSTRVEMVGSAIQTATTHEPYGKLLAQTGSNRTTYGFTGEQYNALTSLIYLRARYYHPSLKLFISRDPFPGWAGQPVSQHPYTYVGNNSINRTDPSGNCFFFGIDTLICLGAGVGFLANMGIQTYQNTQAGMPFLEAIYHKNIDWTSVGASTAAGGISGALAPLIPAGTSFGGVLAYGGLDGLISGLIEQSILNQLLCREWDEGLLETGVSSAVAGALTAGVFEAGGRAVSGVVRSLDGNRFVPGRWTGRLGYSGPSGGYTNKIPHNLNIELGLQNRKSIEELFTIRDFDRPSYLMGASGALQGTNKYIYVIDDTGYIWIARAEGVHHPDLVGGANTYGAGEMYIDRSGQIRMINNESGHYEPDTGFFPYLKSLLESKGLTISPEVFNSH
jgi:RHS repeat-associated protein